MEAKHSNRALWQQLPNEIVQTLGQYLADAEWAATRSTCRHWRDNITAAINVLEIDVERLPHRWMMVICCVRCIFPRLQTCILLIGSRITEDMFAERMLSLSISLSLRELELRYLPCLGPLLGATLLALSPVTEMRLLCSLKLSGGPTPAAAELAALSSLRHLEELEILPHIMVVLPAAASWQQQMHMQVVQCCMVLLMSTLKPCPACLV
eukprot:jgi/Chrzof1/4054/Cz13g18190.t1